MIKKKKMKIKKKDVVRIIKYYFYIIIGLFKNIFELSNKR